MAMSAAEADVAINPHTATIPTAVFIMRAPESALQSTEDRVASWPLPELIAHVGPSDVLIHVCRLYLGRAADMSFGTAWNVS